MTSVINLVHGRSCCPGFWAVWNSLVDAGTDSLFQRLQSVQNSAARLITWTDWCEHITPILRELRWLPVRRRVDFKLATFMYKMLHGQIPRYLSGDCQLISDTSRRLRSSDTFTFAVPRTRTRLDDRSFAVAGPQIWNSLPADLHLVDNYARFRRLLKGHMFGWGCGA